MPADALAITDFEDPPESVLRAVDEGLERHNLAAAPLHEVRPLAAIVSGAASQVVGGAVGRTWGRCCELQQLWVEPAYRHQGLATRLVERFEALAVGRGCSVFYLTTLSYQAPAFYCRRGYDAVAEIAGYPNGIVKYLMLKVRDAEEH